MSIVPEQNPVDAAERSNREESELDAQARRIHDLELELDQARAERDEARAETLKHSLVAGRTVEGLDAAMRTLVELQSAAKDPQKLYLAQVAGLQRLKEASLAEDGKGWVAVAQRWGSDAAPSSASSLGFLADEPDLYGEGDDGS